MHWGLIMLAAGCGGSGKLDFLGQGEATDARLTSDVYTWDCQSTETAWMGVLGFQVALEFVPDELDGRQLPPAGSCDHGLSMFAVDSLNTGFGGTALPDLTSEPGWETDGDSGTLNEVVSGMWIDDVYNNVLTCNQVSDVITGGVSLVDAGILDGVQTPEAGSVTLVSVDGSFDDGIPFNSDLDLSWDTSGWGESFVQIRRVNSGIAYETLTCNTTGEDDFTLGVDAWDLFDASLDVDVNYLYVGFRNTAIHSTTEGQTVEVSTRALHVVGIQEL